MKVKPIHRSHRMWTVLRSSTQLWRRGRNAWRGSSQAFPSTRNCLRRGACTRASEPRSQIDPERSSVGATPKTPTGCSCSPTIVQRIAETEALYQRASRGSLPLAARISSRSLLRSTPLRYSQSPSRYSLTYPTVTSSYYVRGTTPPNLSSTGASEGNCLN